MGNNEKREKTIYDKSLFKIFFWSGFPMFMILLFACVVISGIVFLYRRSDPEGVKLLFLSCSIDSFLLWNSVYQSVKSVETAI